MSQVQWYARLHWRAFGLHLVTLFIATLVVWTGFQFVAPEEFESARRGVAIMAVASALTGAVVAILTRGTILRGLDAARTVLEASITGTPTRFGPDGEIEIVTDRLVDSIARLRDRVGRLEQERARLTVLLSGMSEAVLMMDESEHILVANPVAERMLSLPDNYAGRRIADVSRIKSVGDIVSNVLWGKRPAITEVEFNADPGDVRHVWISAAPITEGDEAVGCVVVMYDVTRLRRLERVRRDFVANVSHELRTPIATIQSASETLLMDNMDVGPVSREFVESIFRNSNRLAQIVEDLLTLSRLEAAGEEFAKDGIQISGVVADILDRFSHPASRAGVVLDVDLEDDLMAVQAEPRALGQVFSNLVENGIKYTGEGGTVLICARNDDRRVVITVSDTGIGIPKEHLPRIFERFYRVDYGRSRQVGGTGLGLAIVKHLVRKLGGDIEVHSTPGKGTVFTFWLPAHDGDESHAEFRRVEEKA